MGVARVSHLSLGKLLKAWTLPGSEQSYDVKVWRMSTMPYCVTRRSGSTEETVEIRQSREKNKE